VGPDGVLVNPPAFSQNLHLLERVKDLTVQKLVVQLRVEAFTVPVLPWTAGFNLASRCTRIHQPLLEIVGYELRAIYPGMLFITMTSAGASITLALDQRRSGRNNKLSLWCSSIRFNIRTVLPLYGFALMKS
jgi:hypothetical protein